MAPNENARTSPELGTVRYFGDYELLEEIARGGMGVVYKARQLESQPHRGPEDDPGRRSSRRRATWQRFRAEAEAVARLQHPNIVQIHEVGEHEGRPFFSLEFVRRRQPGQQDRRHAAAAATQAAALVETLARAMHYAHQRRASSTATSSRPTCC